MLRNFAASRAVVFARAAGLIVLAAADAHFAAPVAAAPLTIGQLQASGTDGGVSLSLTAPLAGGTGGGYRYAIYRGDSPTFAADERSLIATVTDLKARTYLDKTATAGRVRYYRVIGLDGSGARAEAVPVGLGAITPARPMPASASATRPGLLVVFIGDSITQGVGAPDAQHAAPALCAEELSVLMGGTPVWFSNQGHSGHTTRDYLPGGSDSEGADTAARELTNTHRGTLIFSIMLGTNDSANRGTNGSPMPAATYRANLKAMVGHLLSRFPRAHVVINHPLWYSPNTHNGSDYELTGLERLTTYDAVIRDVAAHSGSHVHEGDTHGFAFFAANYLTDLVPEQGRNGTFYLHPNAQGAQNLARLWAAAILRAVPQP